MLERICPKYIVCLFPLSLQTDSTPSRHNWIQALYFLNDNVLTDESDSQRVRVEAKVKVHRGRSKVASVSLSKRDALSERELIRVEV